MALVIHYPIGSTSESLDAFERDIVQWLSQLPGEWELFVHPSLNSLELSFVLVSAADGIVLIDVLTTSEHYAQALDKLSALYSEIKTLYCPRYQHPIGKIPGKLLLMFDGEPPTTLHRSHSAGRTALNSNPRDIIAPNIGGRMHPGVSQDIKSWLLEPDYRHTFRTALRLNDEQRSLVVGPQTASGYRRIKGSAGSGKTQVLAARAAHQASLGSRVLLLSFNMTLLNYLRRNAALWCLFDTPSGTTEPLRRVAFLHYHGWAMRLIRIAGRTLDYRAKRHDLGQAFLDDPIAEFVETIQISPEDRYDVILIDEGQDFRPLWVRSLRHALKPGGEFVIALDTAQDLYTRKGMFVNDAWQGLGFTGSPKTLTSSYRLPARVAAMAADFLRWFAPTDDDLIPISTDTQGDLWPCEIRWTQVPPTEAVSACVEEVCGLAARSALAVSIPDTVFVATPKETKIFGRHVVAGITAKGFKVAHTFSKDESEARCQKMSFDLDTAPIKATTVHSFKGLESSTVVVYVNDGAPAALYTALTRVKRSERGCVISIVCANPAYADFGRRHATVFMDLTLGETDKLPPRVTDLV